MSNGHEVIDEPTYRRRLLEIEERKVELEGRRFDTDQRIGKQHFYSIITAMIALAAVAVSYMQMKSAEFIKTVEINITQSQKDREYNLSMMQFVTANMDAIFGDDKMKRDRMKTTMIAFSPEVANRYFSLFESATSEDKKHIWREAQDSAQKASLRISYYGKGIDRPKFTEIRNMLSGEGFKIIETSLYIDKKPSWLSTVPSIIYYDDSYINYVDELAAFLLIKTGETFKVIKGTPFKEIQGQEQNRIFIHYIKS